MKFRTVAAIVGALALGAGQAWSQASYPLPTLPYVSSVGNNDAIQILPNGTPGPIEQYVRALQLNGYLASLPVKSNVLIAGDASQNLFQRGTTGGSTTTTATYGADRWFGFSGTSTAMTISRDSTAGDLPSSNYLYAYKLARTSGQSGVVQVCMAQVVESVNVYQLQGQTAEFDFHATAGANFSAASNNITAMIVYGTGTDEGAAAMAKGINSGTAGGSAWTGQANATAAVIPISATNGRYAAIGVIPTTAKEVGVAICFTPVGTAGTNDYVALSGLQLVRSPALTTINGAAPSTTQGYACTTASGGIGPVAAGVVTCSSFDRSRNNEIEALLQYRYYYEFDETSTKYARGLCRSRSITTCSWDIKYPVPMRIAPTVTYANGFAVETTAAGGTLNNCTLANDTTVASAAASVTDAYALCTATTVPAAGTVDQVYDNSGTGKVMATAEL